MKLSLTLFGPIEVLLDGRAMPRTRSRKALWALAFLTLRRGKPVERQLLAGALWPDIDQSQSFANLRPVLSELRGALGEEGRRLRSDGRHTVSLDLDGADVDVGSFDEAIHNGTLPAIEQAVKLYRGPLLEGCQEDWVFQERNAREQECLLALQKLARSALTNGDYGSAVAYCRRAIAIDPVYDAAHRDLMEALDKDGDRNSALQSYREFADLLHRELGTVPDEKTTALYMRLRKQARQTARISTAIVEAKDAAVAGYLPHPLTALVGRDDEREDVASLLRRSRLVTLTGVGGIGKTRLAVEVASDVVKEYPDGVWLVAFESVTDGRLVAHQVAATLGLREELGRSLSDSLIDHLRKKRLVLVLDNCEHVLESTAQIAGRLLRECGGIRMLATSRAALGITGESVWPVPGLAIPDPKHLPTGPTTLKRVLAGYEGVQLFVERAQAVQPSFSLSGKNALDVAKICYSLEGIPLAIELAAARVNTLGVEEIASRLDNRLGLLTGGSRAAKARQQTLRSTLAWSYELLTPPERALLARLSVFVGGWPLEAAERVCADSTQSDEVLVLLASLVDKSLVVFQEGVAGGRYRLLEMVRQYAAERLEESGATIDARTKHRDWCLLLVETTEPELKGPEQERWLERLEAERGNLRAAIVFARSHPVVALRIAGALWRFWYTAGLVAEGLELLGEAIGWGPEADPRVRAKALYGAGCLAYAHSDYVYSVDLLTKCQQLYRELGDRLGVAEALNVLGNVAAVQSKNAEARRFYEDSLVLRREVGHKRDLALGLYNLASMLHPLAEYDAARPLLEESLELFREVGDTAHVAWSLIVRATIAECQGDHAADGLSDQALALFRGLGNRRGVAWSLYIQGAASLNRGDFELSRAQAEESLSLFREIGDRLGISNALVVLGASVGESGDTDSAWTLLEESLSHSQAAGIEYGVAKGLSALGLVAREQGRTSQAKELLAKSLKIRVAIEDLLGVADTLGDIAMTAADEAGFGFAARLWGAAEQLRDTIRAPLSQRRRSLYEESILYARRALGDGGFEGAWSNGRAMDRAEATLQASKFGVSASPSR